MFFLGASANLFIYLLISAFVIVCCYCKGIAGSPEVTTALTETVAYKSFTRYSSKKTYFYQIHSQKQQKQERVFVFLEKKDNIIPYSAEKHSIPIIQQLYLRAPPTYLFI